VENYLKESMSAYAEAVNISKAEWIVIQELRKVVDCVSGCGDVVIKVDNHIIVDCWPTPKADKKRLIDVQKKEAQA